MKVIKSLYLKEVRYYGCSTSTRPRVLLTIGLVQAAPESILDKANDVKHNGKFKFAVFFPLIP